MRRIVTGIDIPEIADPRTPHKSKTAEQFRG